ncbi:MAG TPA: hypothetical protein VFV08_05870, partial [Puia sp.]|nr:hypothetical protein [Puia sp.]
VVGCTDTSSGSAGNMGELQSTTIAAVSAVSLSNATASNIMSVSLTPGDWDVYAQHVFTTGTAITQVTQLGGSVNSTAAFNAVAGAFSQQLYPSTTTFSASGSVAFFTGPFRVSIAATSTYMNVMQANFSTGSVSAWGALRARRIR